MSSLFSVVVQGVEDGVGRVRFQVVHPDQWEVHGTRNVALQVLVEIYWFMREGYGFDGEHARRGDLGAARAAAHPMAAELEQWLELSHGKKETITQAQYEELCRGEGPWARQGGGYDGRRYYAQFATDYEGFCEVADAQILEVWLEDEIDNPRDEDDGDDPEGTLCFRVKDEALLSLLITGLQWESAMYDYEDYY
jgi:hypothetical protein